ncbi:MAG: helix-turn-helix transcriptional regulator [Clostridia bacterium]|nr:helix-turn-helix transcriptional regulator [Clostridia bacterium]
MLDQKIFGEKLRNHRKKLGMTQEEVAEAVGVSPQAISKWEAGDCLPDCFNLKTISDVYGISADVLLETQESDNIGAVASKIEQLCTEFVWAAAGNGRYSANLRRELGEDLWQMWKGIYFAEVGNRELQRQSKERGNLRIIGSFGTKLWDDDGVACVIRSSLLDRLAPSAPDTTSVLQALCSEEGQRLILALRCDKPTPKQEIVEQTGMELSHLNELLLLFTENRIIHFEAENRAEDRGYIISGHCGVAAHMVLAAAHVLQKMTYEVSQFLNG